ncbi:2-vinyl bacteriochlorophyllide hydratase [Acuticoccus sp. MNP-M23]|uniref:2-vinyl bacteriochlorophyllide hydratase n=1 Tax=Acuticoccus sp. MNP-M23 TaxID=3072793 RepID=UPI002815DEC6|nr:2-vinyl bacteriochlorophyllide hydratase [Acuticoccus sp. MNP-M23]WMS45140.1 2-vinyl bacteriochlorophyllide hydratase [Acuticoccus sp. MNP-M23]
MGKGPAKIRAIYTPEERARRDATRWTTVQALLAPLQFLVFLVSLALVLYSLATGTMHGAAAVSVLIKTGVLLTIMVTGAIWEKVVFGQYLFAPSFFWEDVFSFGVIALHLAYCAMLFAGIGTPATQLTVALAAYAAYLINAGQFLWKLALARRTAPETARTAALGKVRAA